MSFKIFSWIFVKTAEPTNPKRDASRGRPNRSACNTANVSVFSTSILSLFVCFLSKVGRSQVSLTVSVVWYISAVCTVRTDNLYNI